MQALSKACLLLAPVSALALGAGAGKDNPTPVADVILRSDDTHELSFQLNVVESKSKKVCGYPSIAINGKQLPAGGEGAFTLDHDTTISAHWSYGCLGSNPETGHQLMTMAIDEINGKPVTGLSVTVDFRQIAPTWLVVDESGGVSSVVYRPADTLPDVPELPWGPEMPDTPVAPTSPDMPDMLKEPGMPEVPGMPKDLLDALDFEVAELDLLYQQRADLDEMIEFQEQRLAQEYGWISPDGESDCHGLKCLFENIIEKVGDAAMSIYEDIIGVEDTMDGPGHGPGKGPGWRHPKHPKHPKHGRPGRKPHCPGKGPHHGGPHHGNHTHGNHTFPHPPPWRRPPHRFPHHPPPFCRCPPPPHRGRPHHPPPPPPPPGHPPHRGGPDDHPPPGHPPHRGGPDDHPPPGHPPHRGGPDEHPPPGGPHRGGPDDRFPGDHPPHRGPPHGRPGHDDGRPPPDNETDMPPPGHPDGPPPHHPGEHGIPPPPPHPHHHGPPRHHIPLPLKIAAASTIFVVLLALHRRLHGKYASCLARREARRRRRAERKQFLKRLLFGPWLPRHDHPDAEEEDEEEKEAMLRNPEEESRSMEEELASCRMAADMVGDMVVAAEEGRMQSRGVPRAARQPVLVRFVGDEEEEEEEELPAYDERSDSDVADGLRYTPGSSDYAPSVRGVRDDFDDRKE